MDSGEQFLNAPPPPPPANVEELKEDGPLKGTLRQKMEQHRKNPSCATCHQQMDSLGFALENYDAIGAWRTRDDGFPVDASGELPKRAVPQKKRRQDSMTPNDVSTNG